MLKKKIGYLVEDYNLKITYTYTYYKILFILIFILLSTANQNCLPRKIISLLAIYNTFPGNNLLVFFPVKVLYKNKTRVLSVFN